MDGLKLLKDPQEVLFHELNFLNLGQEGKLYVDDDREISVWDDETDKYIVSNYTQRCNKWRYWKFI